MRSIGIFDSGVGGLTVVRAVRERLPDVAIHYLGDTARVPYGSKSARTVERYSLACLRFLLRREVELVMVACNTASANALPALEEASPRPIIGAVLPGARTAVSSSANLRIGVIGTLSTVRSRAYETAIEQLAPGATVTARACPLLVPLAEEGWTDGDVAEMACRRYLSELFESDPELDTLVLGCTHYPLLIETLERVARQLVGRPISVVDSASAMAADAAELGQGDGDGRLRCYVTDATRLDELGERFLGAPIDELELVDL